MLESVGLPRPWMGDPMHGSTLESRVIYSAFITIVPVPFFHAISQPYTWIFHIDFSPYSRVTGSTSTYKDL